MTSDTNNHQKKTVSLVGGRGYVGQQLIKLIDTHPYLELTMMSSRQWQGQPVGKYISDLSEATASMPIDCFEASEGKHLSTDILILALPNGLSSDWVKKAETENYQGLILDLSTDHRFESHWQYGLPELYPVDPNGPAKISNPGCYATAMQLALYPVKKYLAGLAHCFGVSGFSGAGTKPSDFNNQKRLKENLLPYRITEHFHQQEVSEHLQHPIRFMPHVASFFSGINMTISVPLKPEVSLDDIYHQMSSYYAKYPLVDVINEIPEVQMVVNQPKAIVGGFAIDQLSHHLVLVCCLDNLQKGAASQAIQNLNLYYGWEDSHGLVLS